MVLKKHIRFTRPTDNLKEIKDMYIKGLDFELLFEFQDHQGFDGVILGHPKEVYHLEFTHHRGTTVGKAPTKDNLIALYLPDLNEYNHQCKKLIEAGFKKVVSYNPYWDNNGSTYEDIDGYRIVLANISFDH
ncbi:hypothetical protein DICPUDRAFT_38615 [Dictyostelium purpureum]|uniref:VOC domain-containing protein n=1 Tax=Dictyostelium purpureum TaxID=5786 RepID=F0ZUU8_DICPU|nr:uncharacterized protein DICPUDRAFT_38615 [Dictyostelium purpureum]EGC32285.1 hypothetical protein DICPUDRAFT_38615 [Dictyostelium purpureum]|eukprot:XP_003291194.1 hypothetical protein DICPUDRAFT_38615 [Dictyostelium purpureum]